MIFLDPQKVFDELHVAEGMHVADFGSGAGYFTHLLADRVGQYGRVYAFDNNQDLLGTILSEARRKHYGHVRIVHADLASSDKALIDESVDRILIANTVFSLTEKNFIFGHAFSLLKNGGKVTVIDWKPREDKSIKGIGPHSDHHVAESEMEKLASFAGLVKERNFFAGNHHYGIVFKKI